MVHPRLRLAVRFAALAAICASTLGCEGGGDGGSKACTAPASASVTCATPGWYYCGKNSQSQDLCCGPDNPFTCPNGTACYATLDAAAAACGNSCLACVQPTPICASAGAGTCTGSGQVFCGGTTCCNGPYPFYCASTKLCYATADAAKTACGTACLACTPPTPICGSAGTGTCSLAGHVFCGGTICCSGPLPFYCASANLCYATADAAKAACGAACLACSGG